MEVGEQATPFEHRSFGEELALCQRYYYEHCRGTSDHLSLGDAHNSTQADCIVHFPVTMRATPTLDASSGTDYWLMYIANSGKYSSGAWTIFKPMPTGATCYNSGFSSMTAGNAGRIIPSNASAYMAFDAEL